MSTHSAFGLDAHRLSTCSLYRLEFVPIPLASRVLTLAWPGYCLTLAWPGS